MRNMQAAAVWGGILCLLLGASSAYAADTTWAVFDSKRAMETTKHFKDAKTALEKELKERQTKLESRKKALEERREALDAKKAVASSQALDKQEAKLSQEEQELSQLFMRARQELGLYEQKLKEQLFRRLEAAVKQVAQKGNHTFVIDAGKVLFHRPALDITDAVVQVYVERFGDQPLDLSSVKLSQRANAK